MSRWWTLFLLASLAASASANAYYAVVAPRLLRPNSEFHAAVSVYGTSEPTTVVVEVGGKQDSGGIFKNSQFVTVPPYTTRLTRLEIGDIGPGIYNLTVRGEGGMNFVNSTKLGYDPKSFSIFVQTDKAIYKPGHKVQFRAIVLNPHLRPSVTAAVDIHISDADGNRVKQWTRVLPTRGVFSEEFQLSESPVLGDWSITVTVLDQKYTKYFQVAEYVLPKFDVSIEVPQHATFKESRLVAVIRSKYTYGKPLKGEATVTAFPSYFSEVIQPIYQHPVRKVVPIDGKASVEFDIVEELQLMDDYERVVRFDVTVEEALTGRRQNNSAQTVLHKHKYKFSLVKTADYFKRGLKYTAFVKLSHHDGTPVVDKTNPVKIYSGYSYASKDYTETIHKVSPNGIIELTFYPPLNETVLGIEAEYLDVRDYFPVVVAANSPSNTFIRAYLKTENPTVNNDVEVEVNSTSPLRYISYQVFGRGDVVFGDTVRVTTSGAKTVRFRFLATFAMAPTAHLVVQYISDEGEVIADYLGIELDGALQNFVKLDVSPTETEPGASVEIKLESVPASYIGLLGVDQSVLLLKSGNDITQEKVMNELQSYDEKEYSNPYRSLSAREEFLRSGAVILTNGLVYTYTNVEAGMRAIARDGERRVKPDSGPYVPIRPATRPPLAGPYAFSRIPAPVWNKPRVFLPHQQAQTWLFANLSVGFDGKASLRKNVPDTITSWVITAFSVEGLHGLGVIDIPRKVKVFRPFFVSLDLPYSIIRGETIAIPVVVFNYMDNEVTADVTIENSGQFEFADYSNDVYDTPKLELYRRKKLVISPNSGSSTSFMITPKEIGYISIKVSARSSIAGDAVEKKLLVKPEGETQYRNKAIFVDLRNSNSFKTNVTLDIPVNIVPGSELIEVSAVGDILGPSIPNLENLIKMPFGCGEQNMLNFVPNIVILDYLKNSKQLTQAIESKSIRFLETGYQQELTYKHPDGSYSAFGKADPSGSTWLTAFVAKSFRQASRYISVEESVIEQALQWLATKQASNGSFPEVGQVSHKDLQGGSSNGLALTAYTLITFLESRSGTVHYNNVINKAVDYIVRYLDNLNDPYTISICTYALHLYQHPTKDVAFNLLETKAQSSTNMKWWKRLERESDKKNPHSLLPNSVDVEMTAYSLLSYLNRGLVEDSIPIMRWLVTQQNDEGGFASTQDTVIALTALAKLAEVIVGDSNDITVKFMYGKGASNDIRVNSANSMILQKQEISKKVRNIDITANGRGFAVAQVSYRFNVNVTGAWPMFTLDPQVDKNSDTNHLRLSICSGFIGSKEGNESNMAVMEIVLPSGFVVDTDTLPSLQLSQNVKRFETSEGDTKVMLYFDKMTRKEYCPTVSAFRTHKVAKQRPVPVTIYDYYDQSRRARMFYEPKAATLCEICEGEDCRVCSGGKIGSQSRTPQKDNAPIAQLSIGLLISSILLIVYNFQ